jgi:hypothetical protein
LKGGGGGWRERGAARREEGRGGVTSQKNVSKNWKELQRTEEKIFVKCRERN